MKKQAFFLCFTEQFVLLFTFLSKLTFNFFNLRILSIKNLTNKFNNFPKYEPINLKQRAMKCKYFTVHKKRNGKTSKSESADIKTFRAYSAWLTFLHSLMTVHTNN